jgi:hypothetical protein
MHRVSGGTWSAVGVGLFAVFLVVGFGLGTIPLSGHAAPAASGGSTAARPVAPTHATTNTRSYVPLITVTLLTTVPADIAVPFNLSYDVNMTWGTIDNTHTNGTVVINYADNASHVWKTFYITGTVVPANVLTYTLNGIPYSNYVWNFSLDKTTLGCSTASCAGTIPNNDTSYNVTLMVSESGGSANGNTWGPAAALPTAFTAGLVVTYVSATLVTPAAITNMADSLYGMVYAPVGTIVTVDTNISWGATTNATTNFTIAITNATGANLWVLSFNNTVGATEANHAGVNVSSTVTFSGSVGGVPYSAATWMVTLNESTLNNLGAGCNSPSCANKLSSDMVVFAITVGENGVPAGGTNTGYTVAGAGTATQAGLFGSTLYDSTENLATYPAAYQALPVTISGTVTLSWSWSNLTSLVLGGTASPGNKTFEGSYIDLTYTNNATTDGSLAGQLFANFSIDNSVNTVNAYGASLIPMSNQTWGPGVPYNLTVYMWSITLNTSNSGWTSTTVPYLDFNLTAYLNGYGNVSGAWGNRTTIVGPIFYYTTLAQYPTTASATFTTPVPGYVAVPYVQNFTIAVTNAQIDPTTTTVLVNVTDLPGHTTVSSTAETVAPGQTAYTFTITPAVLVCELPSCAGFVPGATDVYSLSVFVGVDGIGTPAGPGAVNGTLAQGTLASSFYAITVPLSVALTPSPGATLTPGNVSVSVVYSGTFVETVSADIYSPTGALVFSNAFGSSGANATWLVTSPGTYKASVVVVTAYPNPTSTSTYFNSTLTVNKVPRTYVNSTSYSNSTLIPGLSPGAAGTLLLVVGLIIGMIVALLLGRAVWGGRQSPTPPQAWESQTGAGAAGAGAGAAAGGTAAAGANSCSVCGKSFASPEELAAHQKSEHGME